MNTMTDALIAAGVPVPTVKERLWNFIRENPGVSTKQIKKVLTNLPEGTITSQTSMLERANLIYSRKAYGEGDARGYKTYFTSAATYKPPRKWPQAPRRRVKPMPASLPPLAPPRSDPPTNVVKTVAENIKRQQPIDLDSLTLAQARELYQQLKKIFEQS